jgi:hypothetical protein
MLKSAIQPGIEYAFCEKRVVGAPFQHVRILDSDPRCVARTA